MNIVIGILSFFLITFIFSLVYGFWGWISSLLMAAATGLGYGIGKFIGIKPRSQAQTDAWVGLNVFLQVIIEWGLMLWIVSTVISFYWENPIVEGIEYYTGYIWAIALFVDLLVLFILGLMYGKVESLIKKGMSPK